MSSLTIRLMSANGKGFSNAAFTMLNSPVAAAIPTARETTAVAAKPGLRRKIRSAYRRSTARMSSKRFPQRRARKEITTQLTSGRIRARSTRDGGRNVARRVVPNPLEEEPEHRLADGEQTLQIEPRGIGEARPRSLGDEGDPVVVGDDRRRAFENELART